MPHCLLDDIPFFERSLTLKIIQTPNYIFSRTAVLLHSAKLQAALFWPLTKTTQKYYQRLTCIPYYEWAAFMRTAFKEKRRSDTKTKYRLFTMVSTAVYTESVLTHVSCQMKEVAE